MWHDQAAGRYWKFTDPAKAGLTYEVAAAEGQVIAVLAHATPLEYLERLMRHNDFFGDDIELEALVIHDGQPCLASLQSFIHGTAPTEDEIETMMRELGFLKSPRGEAFYRPEDSMAAWDAHVGNFLNSGGVVVPIDVIGLPASPLMVEALGF